jgi:hypothetical protein
MTARHGDVEGQLVVVAAWVSPDADLSLSSGEQRIILKNV